MWVTQIWLNQSQHSLCKQGCVLQREPSSRRTSVSWEPRQPPWRAQAPKGLRRKWDPAAIPLEEQWWARRHKNMGNMISFMSIPDAVHYLTTWFHCPSALVLLVRGLNATFRLLNQFLDSFRLILTNLILFKHWPLSPATSCNRNTTLGVYWTFTSDETQST